jgi:glucose/mannose transport system substrate-binding protein
LKGSTGLTAFQGNHGESFWWNKGENLSEFIRPVDDVAERGALSCNIPEPVLASVTLDGALMGVPVNIHRNNTAYYNQAVLENERLRPPTSVDALVPFVQTLLERGYTQPLCVGNKWDWTMDFFVFEALVPALAGAEYHRAFWTGQGDPEDDVIVEALELALQLWPAFNPDADDLTWSEGVDKLFLEGLDACVMTVMGDWATRHIEAAGWRVDEDFRMLPFPGSSGIFVFAGEAFGMGANVPEDELRLGLMSIFGSIRGQTELNRIKGSVPARLDVNPGDFSAAQQKQLADLASDTVVGSFRVLSPHASFADLGGTVKEMLATGDVQAAVNALRRHYDEAF